MFKKIGIIVATEQEYEAVYKSFLGLSTDGSEIQVWDSGDVFVLNIIQSGVGYANAAASTQLLIQYGCDCILNVGFSGSLHSALTPGDVVLASYTYNYNIDLTTFGLKLGQLDKSFGPDQHTQSYYVGRALSDLIKMEGTICSGDTFITQDSIIDKNVRVPEWALCCDMESGAINQICQKEKIPFISIRVISDTVFDYDSEEIYKESTVTLQDEMSNIIKRCVDALAY